MITELLGGDSPAMRTVWEAARGLPRATPASVDEADKRLHSALRGLRLAVGFPTEAEISNRCGLNTTTVREVLNGGQLRDWLQLAALTSAMSVDPACIRPYWEDLERVRNCGGTGSAQPKEST
ncbi:hypothetical protein [Streptomyces decoyicus]|uniref:hypothetical protein n=1 Tax=Streptomyces decoyicus TaxID=249567 RepID=UPI003668E539